MEILEKNNVRLICLGKKVYENLHVLEENYILWIEELQDILDGATEEMGFFYAAEAFRILELSDEEKLLAVVLLYVRLQTGMPLHISEAYRILSVNLVSSYRKSPALCFVQKDDRFFLSPVFVSFIEGRKPVLPEGMDFHFLEEVKGSVSGLAMEQARTFIKRVMQQPPENPEALVLDGEDENAGYRILEMVLSDIGMPVLWVCITGYRYSQWEQLELIECAMLYGAFVCVDMQYADYSLLNRLSGYLSVTAVVIDLQKLPLKDTGYLYRTVHMDDREKTGESLVWMNVLKTRLGFEDLKLPAYQSGQLRDICDMISVRARVLSEWGFSSKYSYGNGMSILFYGAPGTGKTMAAGVMANALGMPLYRVDLSQLISKYIGETQKNIGKVFDAAEKKECVLLFDEADAVFSKRSDVSDAQDRYSNAETAYLLQRIEQYNGVSILATNLLQNFDEAFRRRISYMVHFPLPDVELRRQLWESIFPKEAEINDDFDALALSQAFELSGAAIKNAALHSAYMAMAKSEPISMKHILQAVSNEYAKVGKSLSKAQTDLFRAYCSE